MVREAARLAARCRGGRRRRGRLADLDAAAPTLAGGVLLGLGFVEGLQRRGPFWRRRDRRQEPWLRGGWQRGWWRGCRRRWGREGRLFIESGDPFDQRLDGDRK